jgi:hypothetical protein
VLHDAHTSAAQGGRQASCEQHRAARSDGTAYLRLPKPASPMGYGRSFCADEPLVLPTKLLPSPNKEAARKKRNQQQQWQQRDIPTVVSTMIC